MQYACTPSLVDVAFLILEILLLLFFFEVPFSTMNYNSPWSQQIELAQKIHASRG